MDLFIYLHMCLIKAQMNITGCKISINRKNFGNEKQLMIKC